MAVDYIHYHVYRTYLKTGGSSCYVQVRIVYFAGSEVLRAASVKKLALLKLVVPYSLEDVYKRFRRTKPKC
jgi:hypothetical protein